MVSAKLSFQIDAQSERERYLCAVVCCAVQRERACGETHVVPFVDLGGKLQLLIPSSNLEKLVTAITEDSTFKQDADCYFKTFSNVNGNT